MPLVLEDPNKVYQRTRPDMRQPGTQEALRALFKHFQQLRNPDLKLVPITGPGTDEVISDSPCRLYALCLRKPPASTVDAWVKGQDHASTVGANGDVVVKMVGTGGGGREYCMIWPDGLKLATGLAIASHTANNGSTDSNAADQCTGFAIVGAP